MPEKRDAKESRDKDDVLNNNSTISVILLIGLPASGKSTLARKLEKRFNDDTTGKARDIGNSCQFIHIEYDDLEDGITSSVDVERKNRDSTGDDFGTRRVYAWNQARQHAVEQMEQEIQKIIGRRDCHTPSATITNEPPTCGNDTVILMDDNYHLRGMRKQIHRQLLSYRPIRFGILYMETPLEVCLERNRQRSGRRQVPDGVIVKMSTSFEPPRVAWEVSSTKTIVDSEFGGDDCVAPATNFEEIVEFIENCPDIVELPPEPDEAQLAADRARTKESQTHSLDKRLRSYVGRVAKFDKTLAKKANSARKTVMEDFKAGRIDSVCIGDAFLDLVVPIDPPSTTANYSGDDSIIRLQLKQVLDAL